MPKVPSACAVLALAMAPLVFPAGPAYLDPAGLLAMPWRGGAALRRTQERKLCRVVRHAARHVPFYRELLRSHGIDPREIRNARNRAVSAFGSHHSVSK